MADPHVPYLGIPTPADGEVPFTDTMVEHFRAVDFWLTAVRENGDALLALDGSPWSLERGTLFFGPIFLASASGAGSVRVDEGSLAIEVDPAVVFLRVPTRPFTGMSTVALECAASLPVDPLTVVLGYVADGVFYPLRAPVPTLPRAAVARCYHFTDSDAAGSGEAAHWSPRTLNRVHALSKGLAPLPVEVVALDLLRAVAAPAAFVVRGDATGLCPVGMRFRVRESSTANDSTDLDYLVAGASYDGVADETTVAINTTTLAGYIKTTISAADPLYGYLDTGWLRIWADIPEDRLHVRFTARGVGYRCDDFALALVDVGSDPSMLAGALDADTGALTVPVAAFGEIVVGTHLGRAPNEEAGVQVEVSGCRAYHWFKGAYLRLCQYIVTSVDDGINGSTWQNWGRADGHLILPGEIFSGEVVMEEEAAATAAPTPPPPPPD